LELQRHNQPALHSTLRQDIAVKPEAPPALPSMAGLEARREISDAFRPVFVLADASVVLREPPAQCVRRRRLIAVDVCAGVRLVRSGKKQYRIRVRPEFGT